VVVLPALPMNANGKLDRAQLPAPEHDDLADQRPFVPPATPVEQELAQLCAEVLGVPAVGMADNFLSLGGHSLLAVRLVAQIRARLGAEVSLRAVFEAEDLAALALEVLQRRSESVDADELAGLLDEIEAAGSATDDEEVWESDAQR
jgi:acyl carrier protein